MEDVWSNCPGPLGHWMSEVMTGIGALADSPFDFVIVDLSVSGCGPSEPDEAASAQPHPPSLQASYYVAHLSRRALQYG